MKYLTTSVRYAGAYSLIGWFAWLVVAVLFSPDLFDDPLRYLVLLGYMLVAPTIVFIAALAHFYREIGPRIAASRVGEASTRSDDPSPP